MLGFRCAATQPTRAAMAVRVGTVCPPYLLLRERASLLCRLYMDSSLFANPLLIKRKWRLQAYIRPVGEA